MAIAVKPGATLSTKWEVQRIRQVVERVWARYGLTATITSGMDGTHRMNSKHYDGLAEDYRTKDIPQNYKHLMFAEVRALLGTEYQVIFESAGNANEHLHVEYDPK